MAHSNDPPTYPTPAGEDNMPLHPSTRCWEISREQVNIIKVIRKGAFSQVAQATVQNLRGSQESITVAVKMLKGIRMMLICESFRFFGHACITRFHL